MIDFQPYFTNDGSVGLYSQKYDDIYHSASGALTEAYEKFIYPINWDILLQHDNIKILDICYGIGYNTKSFLNFIFENKKKLSKIKKNILKNKFKNSNIESIHTDNNFNQHLKRSIDKIYTNNIFDRISVNLIDNDEILVGLSPLIKTGNKKFTNNPDTINKHDIKKYLSLNSKNYPKINKLINYQILVKIIEKCPNIYQNSDIIALFKDPGFIRYLYEDLSGFILSSVYNYKNCNILLNLHNIYYRYISYCYKIGLKLSKLQDFEFNIKIDDARKVIKRDNNLYNLIFLDAFTPSKCPCLWTYDFFKELYSHMQPDGMLLTYSSAAQIRSAMIEAGFKIGYIYNKRLDKYQGTVAAKDCSIIKYPLSESDLGLLNSKAGIFYRDENLSALNEDIMRNHDVDIKNSDRISSSQYLKSRRRNEV